MVWFVCGCWQLCAELDVDVQRCNLIREEEHLVDPTVPEGGPGGL
jgi:hypothetical protein